jgi:hypothetical protein
VIGVAGGNFVKFGTFFMALARESIKIKSSLESMEIDRKIFKQI